MNIKISKIYCQILVLMLIILGSGMIRSQTASSESVSITELENPSPTPTALEQPLTNLSVTPGKTASMARVTSVSSLTDVQPTDWAFSALQSLVERYGCIEGYPDSTYRGNRAMTRYEFAAGLNQCLNRINELIAAQTSGVSKEDLATLERLVAEFSNELTSLRGRLSSLEARATTIEKQQFSATTKLRGEIITYLGDAFGENASDANNTTFGYRARLSFVSSFTGKDTLLVRLQATNLRRFDSATEFPVGALSGATNETRFVASTLSGNGEVRLNLLAYSFPLTDNLSVRLGAFGSDRILSEPISQLNNSRLGPISNYGQVNPLIYPVNQQTGILLQWQTARWLNIDFSLSSEGPSNNPSVGVFNGGYSASVRPVINLGRFRFTGFYVYSYSPEFGIDTLAGSNAAKVIGAGPVAANTYIGAAFYRILPSVDLGGSVAYSNARALGEGTKGDAQVWDYDVNLTFYDLGKKGNIGGLIVGVQPRLAGTSNGALSEAIGLPPGQRSDRDVGYHIEAFYTYRINNNIAVTPGLIWLTAPNQDERNPDMIIGVVRTSFTF
ncbi:iron uptake porin [Argonema antarcticum]|uniref:iron uptake porin n=1 Tax=Argonema antarcticum TaxID=2942763 RepID=UPI002012406C|nr:iron uptake porin [Argonema antarcticum]MCL1472969.1 iron uptake porin [Argonema antarcticum A004/B2]